MRSFSVPLAILFTALGSMLYAGDPMAPIKPADYQAPVRVVCIGDSITEGIGADEGKSYPSQLQELLGPKWEVLNCGLSGRTLLRKGDFPYWVEDAFTRAKDFKPDVVVIMLGTNDSKPQNWQYKDEFAGDYKDLVAEFQKLPSKPRIYVCRPCPIPDPGNYGIDEKPIQEQIPLINQLAKEQGLGVIDMNSALRPYPEMLPDKVHPNTAGATVMAKTVYEALTGKKAK